MRAVCACLLLALASGCVTKGRYDEVVGERDALAQQRAELQERVERLAASNQSLSSERERVMNEMEDLRIEKRQLDADVRQLSRAKAELTESLTATSERLAEREAEIERMRGTYDALVADLQEEVTAGQIQIERLRSGLKMNLSQEILFPSGSAVVNPGGTAVLRKVAAQLARMDYDVAVVGHTDDVPIARGSYPSNWELAAARASSVVRLLAAEGVDPTRLSVVSRGEFAPIASNDTADGRAINRRIEIQLEPPESGAAPEPDQATPPRHTAPTAPTAPPGAEGDPAHAPPQPAS